MNQFSDEKLIVSKPAGFSCRARLRSFVCAWSGTRHFFTTGHNAQIHLLAAVVVAIVSFFTGLNKVEALAIIFAIGLVWITEMINTAIERIMDFITVRKHPQIKYIKDVAAGAVLIASIVALIVACIVFIPKFTAI